MCKSDKCASSAYATYQSKPSAAIHNVEDVAVKPDLICDPCKRAISACPVCKYINSNLSLIELQHLEIMRDNMSLVSRDDGTFQILVNYPQLKNPNEVFQAKNARVDQVIAASKRLRSKLLKLNMLDHFHKIIQQAIDDEHLAVVAQADIMCEPVNFLPLNFVQKDSESTPVRPVSNGSYNNKAGVSLNSNCITGPTILGSGIQTILGFRSREIGFNADISKFYRCILTSQQTNQLRRIFWFSDPSDESSLVCLEFKRVQFGDASASAFSELSVLDYVAPECRLDELRTALSENRLVDDIASSCPTLDKLNDIKEDMETTFKRFGFSLKHFLYSFMPLEPEQKSIEKVLGLLWDLNSDTLSTNVVFNAHEKKRGKYSGGELTLEQCLVLAISKTILARFSGQGFEFCGVLICPIQTSLRITFSKACILLDDWNMPLHLVDEDADTKARNLIKSLVKIKDRVAPIPRCFARNSVIRRLYISSDASQLCLGFTIHVLSVDPDGVAQSHLILARSAIHHMSVPHAELTALLKGVKGLNEVITMSKFLADTPDLHLIFCIDTLCGAHSLAPNKVHTDVRVRNSSHSIHRILSDVVHSHPNIRVSMVHVASAANPADVVSRGSSDPSVEANSPLYRHGPDIFFDPSFPLEESVFLSFSHDEGAKFTYPKAQQEVLLSDTNANCVMCFHSYDFCYDAPRGYVPIGNNVMKLYYNLNADIKVSVIDLQLYNDLLADCRSMAKAINVLILLFRWTKRLSSKTPKELCHLAFLKLVKTSQHHYPAKSVKSAQVFTDDFGLLRALTRLDGETSGMLEVDESPVVISPNDKRLTYLLVHAAHLAPSGMLAPQHLGPVLTTARLLQTPYPVFIPHAKRSVDKFIEKCALCNFVKEQPFQGRFSPPRWIRTVKSSNLIFANLSIDSLGPWVRIAFPGSKRTVKYWVLIILCTFSKAVNFVVMENNTRASVTLALHVHSCQYRKPDIVMSDAGTSQVPVVGSDEYVRYFGNHPMQCIQYAASHQMLNQCERFVQELKRILKTVFLQRDRLHLPLLTHPQIQGVLGAVQDVMNSRPIFGLQTYVCANHLIKPYTISQNMEAQIENFQLRLDNLRDSVGAAHVHFVSTLKNAFLFDKSRILQNKKQYDFKTGDICLLFRADRYTLVKIQEVGKFHSQVEIPGTVPLQTKRIHNSKMILIFRQEPA